MRELLKALGQKSPYVVKSCQNLPKVLSNFLQLFATLDVFLTPLVKVQGNLSNKDALITMLISNKRSYVWLTTQKGVFRHDSEMTFNEVSLHAQNLINSLDPAKLGDLSFPLDSSSKLYELLISPFEKEK